MRVHYRLGRDSEFLEFTVTGAQLSDPEKRVMQLHICPKDCSHHVTGPDALHASQFWQVGERRQPCHTLFKEARPGADEEDEMVRLRRHYEARRAPSGEEMKSPSDDDEKVKKKKKKKEKAKEKKEDKAKAANGDSEEEVSLERGQKSLRSLYSGTCLDP